jgi:hypothetical protein
MLFEGMPWRGEIAKRQISAFDIARDYEKYRVLPWARRQFVYDMYSKMRSDPDAKLTKDMPVDLRAAVREFMAVRPGLAYRLYSQFADAVENAEEILTSTIDNMTFLQLISYSEKQNGKRGLPTAVSERLMRETGYSPDRLIMELGLGLFDENNTISVSEYGTFRQDIKNINLPSTVPWNLFYDLAGKADSGYWGDLNKQVSLMYTDIRQQKNPIDILRKFSQEHGDLNSLELAQGAFIVYRELHDRGIEPTPMNIEKAVREIVALRAKYDPIEPFGPGRQVIVLANSEQWNPKGAGMRDRFGTKPFIDGLTAVHGKAPTIFRGTTKASDNARIVADTFKTIQTTTSRVTFIFDGHGIYSSEKHNGLSLTANDQEFALTAQTIAKAFLDRYANPALREQARIEQDIFFIDACYGYDIGQKINEILSAANMPTLIVQTTAERQRSGLSIGNNEFGSPYMQSILAKTLGDIRRNGLKGQVTKPSMMVPFDSLKSLRGAPDRPPRNFMQISGYMGTEERTFG